ncbi:unnamed protein product [Nyctereutes procyonoides]|uniref:(raccoon dog) hypothetical protein n=1 Tax=Nyctereutes procyonoides TaxID=34880 RepID=A0A811YIT6_NYCPR|nr:unnamed protein product [Nyctereutes procyonoides]
MQPEKVQPKEEENKEGISSWKPRPPAEGARRESLFFSRMPTNIGKMLKEVKTTYFYSG